MIDKDIVHRVAIKNKISEDTVYQVLRLMFKEYATMINSADIDKIESGELPELKIKIPVIGTLRITKNKIKSFKLFIEYAQHKRN